MEKLISRLLDTVGDGSGTYSATGNYAAAPEHFLIAPAANEVYALTRMLVSVKDTVGMDADAYGNAITLTNGITVTVEDDSGVIYDLTDPQHNIYTNAHWAHYCYDAQVLTWGSGNEHLVVRWTFAKQGQPIILRGRLGERLVITLNDDFTGLLDHYFIAQGLEVAGEL